MPTSLARIHVKRSKWMNECFFGLQDLEKAEREGDAARRSLREKEAHVQALRAQSAAFDQALDDAKTTAAQVLPVSPGQPLLSSVVSCHSCQTFASAPTFLYALFQFCLGSSTLDQFCPCCGFGPCSHYHSLYGQLMQHFWQSLMQHH